MKVTFYGNGMVWDPSKNKVVATFKEGSFTTEDESIIALCRKNKFEEKVEGVAQEINLTDKKTEDVIQEAKITDKKAEEESSSIEEPIVPKRRARKEG